METFHYRLNGGKVRPLTVKTSIYQNAAAAIPALTGYVKFPVEIEIWCERLLPHYGPYRYVIDRNRCGNIEVSIKLEKQRPLITPAASSPSP